MNRRDFFKTIITGILSIPATKFVDTREPDHIYLWQEFPGTIGAAPEWIKVRAGVNTYYTPVYGLDNENNPES